MWIKDFTTVICDCKIIKAGNDFIVDDIITHKQYRNQGHASRIVNELKKYCTKHNLNLKAFGIANTIEAKSFWHKHGIQDTFSYHKDTLDDLK